MKKKIKLIIILLIVLLILVLFSYYLYNRNNKITDQDYSMDSIGIDEYMKNEENDKKQIKYEDNYNVYYTVMAVISRYLEAAKLGNTDELIAMFDANYITKNNITSDNILDKVGVLQIDNEKVHYEYRAKDLYSLDLGRITIHFVYGTYYNISDLEEKELNLMVELDSVNQTFTIYDYNYMKDNKYDMLKIGDSLDLQINEIPNRSYNTFGYVRLTEEDICNYYFKDYKNLLVFNTKEAYNKLNNEFKEIKYKNQNEFEQYIQEKKIDYFTSNLSEYKVKNLMPGGKAYICVDSKNNYYYFIEKDGIMRYSVMLDNYTIPTEDFIEKYNSLNESKKVALNIKKFVIALNDNNMYYAYNLLSKGFKNNYFKTQEDFENYVNDNLFNGNIEVKFRELDEENGVFKYNITILNKENTEEKIDKTIFMKLNEGTDFEMSFNV